MDLERLSKHQIVLLTLLVSFVTSIATGIVTVTLVAQAPPEVTRTINRVVERTVERVVPETEERVVEVERTVYVKEEDLIASAIERVRQSLVRVYTAADESNTERQFIGLGIITTTDGIVTMTSPASDCCYEADLADGTTYDLALEESSELPSGYAKARMQTTGQTFSPLRTVDLNDLRLGETLIALSGGTQSFIATGLLNQAPVAGGEADVVLDVTIDTAGLNPGSPLFNTNGRIVGLMRTNISGIREFVALPQAAVLGSQPQNQTTE